MDRPVFMFRSLDQESLPREPINGTVNIHHLIFNPLGDDAGISAPPSSQRLAGTETSAYHLFKLFFSQNGGESRRNIHNFLSLKRKEAGRRRRGKSLQVCDTKCEATSDL